MTTPNMVRCNKCDFCDKEDPRGTWICTETGEDLDTIPSEDCPMNNDY